MARKLLKILGVWLLCLPFVQKVQAQGYHQLTIDDFTNASRSDNSGVIAYTNCSIDYRYKAVPRNGYYLLNFSVKLILNHDKSWMDKNRITSQEMLAEVLRHEQGHYAIAYLEQQELLRAVGKTVFSRNYQSEAMNIFNRIDAVYRQLNTQYDDDTQHMMNHAQQVSWNNYLDKRLTYLPTDN